MKNIRIISAITVYCLGGQMDLNILYAETLYVKSSNTRIYEKDSPSSKVTQVVPERTEVQALQKAKNFIEVSLPSGEVGWVFKNKLTNTRPEIPSSIPIDNLALPLDIEQDFALRESSSGSSIRAKDSKDTTSLSLDD